MKLPGLGRAAERAGALPGRSSGAWTTRASSPSSSARGGAVAGYAVADDVTARDLQGREPQWTRAKGADGFCPYGPLDHDRR